MNKAIFSRKKIWAFITSIFIPSIVLFDYFVIKTGLSKLLFDTIKELSFSDVIILLILFLIVGIYIWVYLINKYVRSLSSENIKETLNNNKRLMKINDELRDTCNRILSYQEKIIKENEKLKSKVDAFKSIESDAEIYYILETLANRESKLFHKDTLWNRHYKKYFKDKKLSDFNIIMDHLEEKELIRTASAALGESIIKITRKGLKHLKILKTKINGKLQV